MRFIQSDLLVVRGGGAGLRAAIAACERVRHSCGLGLKALFHGFAVAGAVAAAYLLAVIGFAG